MTNGDKIRQMSDEDLSRIICVGDCGYCIRDDLKIALKAFKISDCALEWLKQEVENEENTNIIRKDI